jgi:hypothetical protein
MGMEQTGSEPIQEIKEAGNENHIGSLDWHVKGEKKDGETS